MAARRIGPVGKRAALPRKGSATVSSAANVRSANMPSQCPCISFSCACNIESTRFKAITCTGACGLMAARIALSLSALSPYISMYTVCPFCALSALSISKLPKCAPQITTPPALCNARSITARSLASSRTSNCPCWPSSKKILSCITLEKAKKWRYSSPQRARRCQSCW